MERFLSKVIPYVPGCPEILAEEKILEAAIELCQESNCWRKEQTATIPIGDTSIPLDLEDTADLVTVPIVRRDGYYTKRYAIVTGNALSIEEMPKESEIVITMAMSPKEDLEVLPPAFMAMPWTTWKKGLAAKAKHLLLSMGGQAWYNPQAAAQAEITFYNQCGKIRREILQGHPTTEMRVTPRPFV